MAMFRDNEWLDARIAKTKDLIVKYEDAIDALSSGAQTYSLDTGQTSQSVTKAQLGSLRSALDNLENRLERLKAKRHGRGVNVRPGF